MQRHQLKRPFLLVISVVEKRTTTQNLEPG